MVTRIAAFVLVIAALVGILLYAQSRKPPDMVSGFIEAHEIRVGSRVGGRVAKVDVAEGQTVAAGDLLLELDPFDLRERLAEAKAILAQRQAQYDRLKTGFRPEEIAQATARRDQLQSAYEKMKSGYRTQEIAAARAQYEYAITQRDLTKENYDRVARSFKTGGASQDDMDRATNEFKVAQSDLIVKEENLKLLNEGSRKEDIEAAKAQLAEANAALELQKNGSRKEDIDAAGAALDAQQSAVAALEKQIAELRIVAPAAGTLEAIDLRPGDLLAPNAPALSLLESSQRWVRAYIPENHLNLTNGQKLRVTVDSFPGQAFEGTVTFVSRTAEPTPNNVQTPEERSKQVFRFHVTLTDPQNQLRPGMSADVWLNGAVK